MDNSWLPICQQSFNGLATEAPPVGYNTQDLTGDGIPDLVVFANACDSTIGQTHWDVYVGSVSGFSATPLDFAVPAPLCQQPFNVESVEAPRSRSRWKT